MSAGTACTHCGTQKPTNHSAGVSSLCSSCRGPSMLWTYRADPTPGPLHLPSCPLDSLRPTSMRPALPHHSHPNSDAPLSPKALPSGPIPGSPPPLAALPKTHCNQSIRVKNVLGLNSKLHKAETSSVLFHVISPSGAWHVISTDYLSSLKSKRESRRRRRKMKSINFRAVF